MCHPMKALFLYAVVLLLSAATPEANAIHACEACPKDCKADQIPIGGDGRGFVGACGVDTHIVRPPEEQAATEPEKG